MAVSQLSNCNKAEQEELSAFLSSDWTMGERGGARLLRHYYGPDVGWHQ